MAAATRTARSRDSEHRRGEDIPVSLLSSVELFNVLVPEKSVKGGLDDPLTLQFQRASASRRPEHSTSLLKSIRLEVCRQDYEPPPLAEERSDGLDTCSQRSAVGRRYSVLYSHCSAPAIHPAWYNLNEQMTSSHDTVKHSAHGEADAAALILKFYACPARGDDDDDTTRTSGEPRCEPFLQLPLNDLVRIQLDDKLRITDLLPVNAVLVQFATHSHPHSHEPYNRNDDYSTSSLRPSSWYISPALYDVLIELTPSPLLSNAASRSDAPSTSWNGIDSNSSAEKKQVSQFFDDTLFDVLDAATEPEKSTEPQREGRRLSDADQDSPHASAPVSTMTDEVETNAGDFPCGEDSPTSLDDSNSNPLVGAANLERSIEENRELRARIQEEREGLQRDLERLQQSRDDGGGRLGLSVLDLQCQLETLRGQTAEIARASTVVLQQTSKVAFLLHAQRIRLVWELRSLYPIELVQLAPVSGGAPPHPPSRFTIRGLELPAALLGSPSSPSQGWNLAPNEEDAFSAAMGYLCQVVVRLGEYLGVPLQHRLYCQSSRSVVQDGATGACYPLFAAPRQPYHHPSPEREKLLAGWDRLQSNIDALVREVDGVNAKSGGAATAVRVPPPHILAKVRRVYDVVTLGR